MTHHAIDAIVLPRRVSGNQHQVGVDAALPKVVAAVSSVPLFHLKLAMKTLQGALGDVDTPGPHRWYR